jgi:hypothetical protein
MFKLAFFALCAVLLSTRSSFATILNPSTFDAVISSTPVVAVAQFEEKDYDDTNNKLDHRVVLSLKKSIKNAVTGKISFHPWDIDSDYYRNGSLSLKKGSFFLALLIPDKEGVKLRPDCASLIPLSEEAVSLVDENLTPEQNVERLLAKGCERDSLRGLSVFFLSQFHTASAMQTLSRYVNDKDDHVADDALSCFARNQQVSVIPLIVERCKSPTFGGASVPLISQYHVREAKPFLEKAMFGYPSGIRVNSIMALSNMANKDSVPFLLLALYDQDPQKFVAPDSCAVLHKILPQFTNDFDPDQYEKQKTRERQLFFSWWRDELAGKHPHTHDKERIKLEAGQTHNAKELPTLNEALFMRSETTRRAAVQALDKLADQSSVPYLLVALRDPQGDVAFGAHRILARLVPELGPVLLRTAFDAKQEQVAEVGAQWWAKHLQDAEEARRQAYYRLLDEKQRQMMEKMKLAK